MDITLLRTFSTTRRVKTGTWSRVQPVFKDAFAPCIKACPLGVDTPRIVELTLQGKIKDACMCLLEANPFPFITGRICPHFCMEKCNRGNFDEATNIREMERFLGDIIIDEKLFPAKETYRGERLAVIGSGPSGLSFAWYASLYGYEVTVFEEKPHPGGMLYWGIPDFRLSRDTVASLIKRLEEIGVRFETERRILPEDISTLKQEYRKVILACGLTKPKRLSVEGAEYTFAGLEVLAMYNIKGELPEGRRVLVIGGGNVAIDVALCFLNNAREVILICVEPKEEMPAFREEVEEAVSLGLRIEDSTGVVRIEKSSEGLVVETESVVITGEEDGFKKVQFLGNRRVFLGDVVVMAVGQERAAEGYAVDMVIGDYASGPSTVAQAIASGREAAFSICGVGSSQLWKREREDVIEFHSLNLYYFDRLSPLNRLNSLEDLTYEAKRCFSCGYCNSCGNCWIFCPDVSILFDNGGKPQLDTAHCKGCGICVEECPRSVIVFPTFR